MMQWNPWRAASRGRARGTIRGNQPGGLAGRRRYRPRVERLEERAAPGDSLRSLLFSFSDIAPVDNALAPPAPLSSAVALANPVLPSTEATDSFPAYLIPLGTEPQGRAGRPTASAPGADAPSAAGTQDQADPLADPLGQAPTPHAPSPPASAPTAGIPGGGGAAESPPSGPTALPPTPGIPADPAPPSNGGAPAQSPGAAAPVAPDPAAAQRAAAAINQTAFDLYQRLAQEHPDNLSFSPTSLSIALAMAYGGARGDTAQQMATVLHFLPEGDRIHADFAALIQTLNGDGSSRPYDLSIADALWGQQGLALNPDFLQLTQNDYGGGLHQVDFAGAIQQACDTINAWADQQTHGMIKNIVSPKTLSPDTQLILTNAAYFNGKWENAFDSDATRDGSFQVTATKDVQVPLMHQDHVFGYLDGGTFQMLSMGYQGGDQSMVVLLPKETGGLGALEQSLTADRLTTWVSQMQTQQVVDVTLPKFTASDTLSLGKDLEALGMRRAFSQEADFSGISSHERQMIAGVDQQIKVEVGEQGTKAAAITKITTVATVVIAPRYDVAFHADHPFLYMIRDNHTGSILFMGHETDPSQ